MRPSAGSEAEGGERISVSSAVSEAGGKGNKAKSVKAPTVADALTDGEDLSLRFSSSQSCCFAVTPKKIVCCVCSYPVALLTNDIWLYSWDWHVVSTVQTTEAVNWGWLLSDV